MSEAEAAEFEALMIEREDVAADVAARQRIKLGLETLEQRGELRPLLKRAPASAGIRRYAMAAAALLVVTAAGVYFSQTQVGGGESDAALLATRDSAGELRVLSSHLLAQTRSDSPEPRFDIPPGDGLLQIQLLVDAATADQVKVVLSTGPADHPKVLGSIEASRESDGMVEVWLRAGRLKDGIHRLTVTPADGSGAAQSFVFELGPD